MAKLVEGNNSDIIEAKDLKDGQIGVMIELYEGRIVQKHGGKIVSIGLNHGNGFSKVCSNKVRVLRNGEKIVIENN